MDLQELVENEIEFHSLVSSRLRPAFRMMYKSGNSLMQTILHHLIFLKSVT